MDILPIAAVAVHLLIKSTAEMEGGDRGVVGRPLAFCRGTYSRWYYVLNNTRGVAAQTLSGEPAVPAIIPGGVASCPIPGGSSSNP